LDVAELRITAENVAFCMTAETGLGLSPTRNAITQAMIRLELPLREDFETQLDALEFIKIARSESATEAGDSKSFTFSHRRFQEYFATCVVLATPDRVTPNQLVNDGRWRETAVVLCQTQPKELLQKIFSEVRHQLIEATNNIPNLISEPIEYIET